MYEPRCCSRIAKATKTRLSQYERACHPPCNTCDFFILLPLHARLAVVDTNFSRSVLTYLSACTSPKHGHPPLLRVSRSLVGPWERDGLLHASARGKPSTPYASLKRRFPDIIKWVFDDWSAEGYCIVCRIIAG